MTFGKNKLSNTISKNQYYSSYCYYSCFFRFRPIRFELLKNRIFRRKYVRKYSTDDRTLATPIQVICLVPIISWLYHCGSTLTRILINMVT